MQYKHCHIVMLTEDGLDLSPRECTVQLDGDRVTVEYDESAGRGVWEGADRGHGHYVLHKTEPPPGGGRATLHRLQPESHRLEGYYVEGTEEGFWYITLRSSQ